MRINKLRILIEKMRLEMTKNAYLLWFFAETTAIMSLCHLVDLLKSFN